MQKIHQILIIDDQPQNLQVLGNVLRNNNFKTGFATSGPNALSILETVKFDLILLDINMPEMDGFEVCEKVRKQELNNDTPIIFLTAFVDEKHILKGLQVGGQDYVTKPFNMDELLARVNTHLELQDSRERLKKLNKTLDVKVKERTQELKKKTEELEVAHIKLKSLDQLKSQFIRLVSHELRTPLTGVVGFTEILRKDLKDTKFEEKVDLLGKSVSRLNSLSSKALLISELEANEYPIQKHITVLKPIIQEQIKKISSTTEKKSIQTHLKIDTQIMVNIDLKLFNQAISEVLKNAMEFSPENGVIEVSTLVTDNHTQISVKNSGSFFPEEILQNPFDYFSEGMMHKNNKIGLGLVIAKLMTVNHGGNIQILNTDEGVEVQLTVENINE